MTEKLDKTDKTIFSTSHRQNLSKAAKKPKSEEQKKKMSEAAKRRWARVRGEE